MFVLSALTLALAALAPATNAQTDFSSAHNVTSIAGTWSSGSRAVVTGSGFAQPANLTFTYPNVTGVSYAFTDDGWYETARYRFNSNGSMPNCITGVMLWHHGTFTFNNNGSITLNPLKDGYQQIQDPCAAESNFIQSYSTSELYQHWQIFMDPTDGPKLHLFDSGGAPVAPLFQVYSTANILPQELLRNTTDVTITGSTLAARHNAARRTVGARDVVAFTAGVFAVGAGSLLL